MVGSGEVEEVNSSRVRYWDDVMLAVDLERDGEVGWDRLGYGIGWDRLGYI